MIVKKTNQFGNFRRGINLYVPKRRIATTPPSPSVIPVDAQNLLPAQLIVTFANQTDLLLYFHTSPTTWELYFRFEDFTSWELGFDVNWFIVVRTAFSPDIIARAINPSTDPTNIPLLNWSYDIGGGNPVSIAVA